MLTLLSNDRGRCSRRQLLQVGTLGIGGLTLLDLLRVKARAGGRPDFVKDKSVVVLNMQGGPTQIETFDPKMTAPVEYRAMFGEVKTRLAGVTFGSHFPKLAAMADRLAIVRSYRHGISSHPQAAKHVMAGGNPTGAMMGAVYAQLAGVTNRRTGMPINTVVPPASLGAEYKKFGGASERVTSTGTLQPSLAPFDPSAGGELLDDMQLTIAGDRLDDRRGLLTRLDALKRIVGSADMLGAADEFRHQAFDVLMGGIAEAFDLSKEDPSLVARYDTAQFDIPQALFNKRTRIKKTLPVSHSPAALGKQMLLARRLCEAGCRFVTVTSNGWDMHGIHEYEIADGMPLLGPAVDRAVSAFLEDLQSRGMADDVLLVMTGEFGRTPKINKDKGRDHWGNLCTLAFAGGGLQMGQVIGRSDRTASAPVGDVVSSSNMLATIMHTLLDLGKLRTARGIPAEITRSLTECEPIRGLV